MSLLIVVSLGLILIAYLFGSIPTGYLAGRILKGIDIRECGSGSTGATNVLRNVGKGAAIAVLIVDLSKGVMAVYAVKLAYLYLPNLLFVGGQDWLIVVASLLAIIGHSKSVWLNFSGGKSAAIGLDLSGWAGISVERMRPASADSATSARDGIERRSQKKPDPSPGPPAC